MVVNSVVWIGCVLFLDNRHRYIAFEEMFRGTIDSAAVYPREVVRRAIEHNAAALILAHNHPGTVCEPSDTDVRLARKLVDALALVDVRVLDHLIVGGSASTSLAERGLMWRRGRGHGRPCPIPFPDLPQETTVSLTTTTAHGVVFGLDLMGRPDETERELAAMSLAAQLHALGVDGARELHRNLSRSGWHDRPALVRRLERLARDRGLSAYPNPVRTACSVGVFPATGAMTAGSVTLH